MFSMKDQRGFTLTELVVALAVVGVMAGAFTITRTAIESARVGRAMDEMEIIATGAAQYAAQNGGSFSGLSYTSIASLGLVPGGFMYPNWNNPWGGYYNVWANCVSSTCFTVQAAYNVPCSSANQLANALSRKGTVTVTNYVGSLCHFDVTYGN